jgi:outer membrane protein OmpA-like peptidoglycan-associated protein
VKPTQARPAEPEVPVYSKAAPAAPSQATAPKPTVTPPPPAAPAPQSSLVPPAPPSVQQAAVAPPDEKPAAEKAAAAASQHDAKVADASLPTIPEERRRFNDPGTYPNLAQVPARPVDLPTFAAAATLEKQLEADYVTTAQPSPPSPAVPSPETVAEAPKPATISASPAPVTKPVEVVARDEDKSPCLTNAMVDATPAATLKFDEGSSALTADDRAVLADAMPSVREAKGTLRILGHGDTETNSAIGAGRLSLAIARAGAVAQALAGYGIPVGRIAIGVACQDTMAAGALVQLYAES